MIKVSDIIKKDIDKLSRIEVAEVNKALYWEMVTERNRRERGGIYGFTQREMAYNSNKIEGSRLTKEHTSSLFDNGEIYSNGYETFVRKDIEEANGHFAMFNSMIDSINYTLDVSIIKEFHRELKQGVFEDRANGYAIGDWKKRANMVSDMDTCRPDMVAEEMDKLVNRYNNTEKSIYDIAMFHSIYEKIHPFQDGNGRTGRMIAFREALRNNVIPFIVRDINRAEYIRALRKAIETHDASELTLYFVKEQKWYYDKIKKFMTMY